ncbi:SDR family NAD(P)-dependent oxidoreductase [Luteithermobacter gelatinilyticus]|uniref:SDR family NAD(P)-dependent oxidoreductase n=1 Tax=Luteithermobacter gelatinilyticus TaxID=2582913 RepID=UPI00110712CB|nr:glucose 1-dehydrogenase [Luteithermobacter gelatinilyticus]|tara:strand:- start:20464 stop:21234 length:771 start_codon:yes stop_codon:yes gene_type:complete
MTCESYADKVVMITGAGSGLGRAAACAFAKAGAKLVLSDLHQAELEETAFLAREVGGEVLWRLCDVRNKEQVIENVVAAEETFGRIDVAINNAGVEHALKPLAQCDTEEWEQTLDVNLKGVFYCMKYELQQMIRQNAGVILNVASIAGISGAPGLGPYAASKHGVVGLTRTAAAENARYNIRVNAICPGGTATPMVERYLNREEDDNAVRKLIGMVPMRRLARVEEIVDGMLWLCSDRNSFMTGQAVVFDGGLTAI